MYQSETVSVDAVVQTVVGTGTFPEFMRRISSPGPLGADFCREPQQNRVIAIFFAA